MNSNLLRYPQLSFNWPKNPFALTFELIRFSLAFQEMTIKLGMNVQLLYWHSYLQLMDKIICEIESSYPEQIKENSQPEVERDLMAGNFHLFNGN
jgi:hypothetical protein